MADKSNPLVEHTKKVAENTNIGKDEEDVKIQSMYDTSTRENDKDNARIATLAAKGKEAEKNEKYIKNPGDDLGSVYDKTTAQTRQEGIENYKQAGEGFKTIGDDVVKDARTKETQAVNTYKANIDNIANTFDSMNTETAAANASDLSNEIAQHDITDPEGREGIENYIKTYEDMLGDKYDEWSKTYNRALMFNAVQNGLAAAFGVPPIDFTQHPDVQAAREQLNDMKELLKGEKATAGKFAEQKVQKGIQDREKKQDQKQQLQLEKLAIDKANVQAARDIANGSEMASDMLKINKEADVAKDVYGVEAAKGRMEEAKLQGRGARVVEHGGVSNTDRVLNTAGDLAPDMIKTAAAVLMK